MGIAFNAAFQKSVSGVGKLGRDCMSIDPALGALDKLAKAQKIRGLSSFISVNPAEAADLLDMDEDELGLPPEQWFAAAEGIACVQGLAKAIAADRKFKNAKPVLEDLKSLESELAAAAKQKVKFHFVVLD